MLLYIGTFLAKNVSHLPDNWLAGNEAGAAYGPPSEKKPRKQWLPGRMGGTDGKRKGDWATVGRTQVGSGVLPGYLLLQSFAEEAQAAELGALGHVFVFIAQRNADFFH